MTAPRPGPLFSVLTASYNHGRYVREMLDSVAGQRCRDFELVFVDDGSTDDTAAVVERWMTEFRADAANRVEYLPAANGGQSAALELGFPLCRGRYIALIDADDRWLPGKLEAVAARIELHPECGLFVHPQFVIDPSGVRTGELRPKGARLSDGDLRDQMRRSGRHVAGATTCHTYRRDVFARLLPMPTRRFPSAADQYLSFGATVLEPVCALEEPLSEYRLNPDGHYIRRMTTPEGVERQVDLQRTIAGHFGLAHVVDRNSFFARNSFASAKLNGDAGAQVRAYLLLVKAVWADAAFQPWQKLAFTLFWGAGLLAPRALFLQQWRWFQWKQTGRNRLGSPGMAEPRP